MSKGWRWENTSVIHYNKTCNNELMHVFFNPDDTHKVILTKYIDS